MGITNYAAAMILDTIFRPDSLVNTDTITGWETWLALHHSDPTAEGNIGTEIAGGGYQRRSLAPAAWTQASNGLTTAVVSVRFTSLPATTVRYLGLWNSQFSGQLLWYGEVSPLWTTTGDNTNGIQVTAGGSITIPPETLVVGFQ